MRLVGLRRRDAFGLSRSSHQRIRDVDGSGWFIRTSCRQRPDAPWRSEGQVALLSRKGDESGVRAWLGPGFRVEISRCDGAWCEVSATAPGAEHASTYTGYLPQGEIWGVYQGESFD